jgi:transposase InsO family protein
MRVHRNAKTTLKMRQLIVARAQHGWTYAQIADALGVSVRTVAKWIARSRHPNGLCDASSRPHRQPRRLAAPLEAAIVALRRTRATAWQISAALGLPRSTVTRVLARVGLNRVALLEPSSPVQRYEWPHVGDLLHLDLKRLGRGIGHRIHGDRRRRRRRAGYEYLHVAIDDATRLTYAEVLPADDAPTCAAFLQRTLAWFRRRGVGVRRLLTDNAMAYRARVFCAVCRRWTIRQRFTRPYRPQTNGKAERFIQTLLREWAYRTPYRSSARRTAALRPYLRFYNHRRPHASLGRRSPWMRFQEAA